MKINYVNHWSNIVENIVQFARSYVKKVFFGFTLFLILLNTIKSEIDNFVQYDILRRVRIPEQSFYSEDELDFRVIYFVDEKGNLKDGFGNLVAEHGKWKWRPQLGDFILLFGSREEVWYYGYLVDREGNLWYGPRNMGKVEFMGSRGYLVYDSRTRSPLIIDGKYVLGSYTGIDLRRDPSSPLFDDMPAKADLERLLSYTMPSDRDPIAVIIDLDTDPPGNYVKFAEIMASNPDVFILVPYLQIYRPGQSLYLRFEDVARRGLRPVFEAELAIFGGQCAGKYVMRKAYVAFMLGADIDEIVEDTWESGNEALKPTIRSEDLHETVAAGKRIFGAYPFSYPQEAANFEHGRIPDRYPVLIFRQTYITSEGELDPDMLFRPYTENYRDANGNIQDNLLLLFVDDTEDPRLRQTLKEGILAKARELGVEDKVFYFHRAKDPAWRGIEEGYMRKVGRVLWMSYFLTTGRNQGKMYTSPVFDTRVRDDEGRIWINPYLYIGSDGLLYNRENKLVGRGEQK